MEILVAFFDSKEFDSQQANLYQCFCVPELQNGRMVKTTITLSATDAELRTQSPIQTKDKYHSLKNFTTSKERPKSAPYLRLKKTRKRKPLFLQLGTTKPLKKLKIEKKNSKFFFRNFFEVSGSAEKCKRGTHWDFLYIHSVAKYQKLMGGTIEKISGKISLTVPKKGGRSHSVEKSGLFCFGMAFYLMLEALDAMKMKY